MEIKAEYAQIRFSVPMTSFSVDPSACSSDVESCEPIQPPAPGQTQGVVQPPRHPHQDYFDEYYSTWDNYAENRDGAILKIMNGVAPTSGRKGKPKRINLDRLRRLKKDLDLYTRDDDLSKKRARLNRLDQDQIVESNHYDLVRAEFFFAVSH